MREYHLDPDDYEVPEDWDDAKEAEARAEEEAWAEAVYADWLEGQALGLPEEEEV